jgi:hypothetical protein
MNQRELKSRVDQASFILDAIARTAEYVVETGCNVHQCNDYLLLIGAASSHAYHLVTGENATTGLYDDDQSGEDCGAKRGACKGSNS